METNALISFTQRKLADYTRDDIREFYDEIQKSVFKHSCEYMRFLDTSTGVDPVLTTVAGTHLYTLNTATIGQNIQVIKNVYSDTYNMIYYNKEDTNYNGIRATVKQGIRASSPATVLFSCDPGDSEYSIDCYRFPTSLTAETIQLEIPDHWHLSHLFYGVSGLVETFQHGDTPTWDKFQRELLPEIQHSLDTEAHKISNFHEGNGF